MLVLAIVATLVAGILALGYYHAKAGPLSHLPGPTWVVPFLGHMAEFTADPATMMWKCYRKYGTVFRTHLFGQQIVVVGDPSLIKQSLSNNHEVAAIVPVSSVNQIVDLTQMQDAHRSSVFRKTVSLALTNANIKARLPLFINVINKHVDAWTQGPNVTELDDKLRAMVVDFALGPIAGFELDDSTMKRVIDLAMVVQGGLFIAPIYFPGTKWYKAINARPEYLALLKQVVHARFHVNELGIVTGPKESCMPGTVDTSSVLYKEFVETNITPSVDNFAERLIQAVLAASETSFGMMLALFCSVQMVSGLQDKLREEQRRVIKQHGAELSLDVVSQHMPLLDAAVKETLRLTPPGHGVFRRVDADDLHIGPYHVPKGTKVLVAFDIENFLDPKLSRKPDPGRGNRIPVEHDITRLQEAFSVERWLVDPSEAPQLFTFSYGPHSCVGMNLAILEAKLVMATVLRKGTLQLLNKDPRLTAFPWVHMANGAARVRFTPDPLA